MVTFKAEAYLNVYLVSVHYICCRFVLPLGK